MHAERFLESNAAPPIDEEEIREALYSLLMHKAPPALVRLIGKDCYQRWGVACSSASFCAGPLCKPAPGAGLTDVLSVPAACRSSFNRAVHGSQWHPGSSDPTGYSNVS